MTRRDTCIQLAFSRLGSRGLRAASSRFALALLLLATACANPRRPPGGPRDKRPPSVASSQPPTGATSVQPSEIRIRFSEYVEPSSFAEAFSLTPSLSGGRPEFDWSGRTVTISLPSALRENTTYRLAISTALQDVHHVSLDTPITLAFATGPQINKGRLSGNVVGAGHGRPRGQADVFAYAAPDSALPDSLPRRPAYRTQTSDKGHFTFTYLSEQPYFVVALKDQNGNRRPDSGEAFAVPPQPVLFADTVQYQGSLRWIMTQRDERAPTMQRLQVLSRRRLSLNFDEPVHLTQPFSAGWSLTDSVQATSEAIQHVYMRPSAPRRIFLATADSLRAHPYWLIPGEVRDSTGRTAPTDTLRLNPTGAPPDTLHFRFSGFLPPQRKSVPLVLGPRQHMGLRFNQPPPDSLSALVTVTDTSGSRRSFSSTTDGAAEYYLRPHPPLHPDSVLQVSVVLTRNADTTYRRRYKRLSGRELGGLQGVIRLTEDTTASSVVVKIIPTAETKYATARAVTVEAGKTFAVRKLPKGAYRLRLFQDLNKNGSWDGGQLIPYTPPEPIRWRNDSLSVRARWDTDLDTLRLPNTK